MTAFGGSADLANRLVASAKNRETGCAAKCTMDICWGVKHFRANTTRSEGRTTFFPTRICDKCGFDP
jgi:hypothetical protein